MVILNDESFEEVSSVRLSRFNVYILLSTLLVILVFLVASAIIFTPLREYIPGYASTDMKGDLIDMRLKTDSLEASANAHDLYFYSDPIEMMAGDVEAPGVFLDASAVLERQYTAFCLDKWVKKYAELAVIPLKLKDVLRTVSKGAEHRELAPKIRTML